MGLPVDWEEAFIGFVLLGHSGHQELEGGYLGGEGGDLEVEFFVFGFQSFVFGDGLFGVGVGGVGDGLWVGFASEGRDLPFKTIVLIFLIPRPNCRS